MSRPVSIFLSSPARCKASDERADRTFHVTKQMYGYLYLIGSTGLPARKQQGPLTRPLYHYDRRYGDTNLFFHQHQYAADYRDETEDHGVIHEAEADDHFQSGQNEIDRE